MTTLKRFALALALLACVVGSASAGAAETAAAPAVGAPAPAVRLTNNQGKQTNLANYRGKWVVLYFYPKDFTSGCTLEAHNFQTDLPKYDKAGAVILGVSVDTAESHKDFCTKEGLGFQLLSDPDARVSAEYGSVMEYQGKKLSARNTFLIAPDGRIAAVFLSVKPASHSEEVLASLARLQKKS
jgi:peroxiredoxin Q/BCP